MLGSTRYHFVPTRSDVEATGGQFLNNDRSLQPGLRQWFGDVSVHTFYRRSQFTDTPVRQFLGLEVSVPMARCARWRRAVGCR